MDDIREVPEAIKNISENPVPKPVTRKFEDIRRALLLMFEQYEESFKIALASRYRAKLKKDEKLAYCTKDELEQARDWLTDMQEGIHDIIDLERRLHVWETKMFELEIDEKIAKSKISKT